ncbi:hypothetical protein S3E15_04939 [Bacillus mycoides]|uniref:Uncharacterized protein n=1 Tax=Bacillus mycoides TaxID=1405 RepID=A0AAP7W422_BACMY|nr:hypothetical protein S3E15_04939 [Bacillus mycoides]
MISGIFNAGYDDIVSVNKMLKVKDIDSKNISSEVAAL